MFSYAFVNVSPIFLANYTSIKTDTVILFYSAFWVLLEINPFTVGFAVCSFFHLCMGCKSICGRMEMDAYNFAPSCSFLITLSIFLLESPVTPAYCNHFSFPCLFFQIAVSYSFLTWWHSNKTFPGRYGIGFLVVLIYF